MIIAAAKTLENLGYNPQETMYFMATDIDKSCFDMTFIQTTLLGLCGTVVWGNSISLETWKTYNTLFFYLKDWKSRFIYDSFKKILNPVSPAAQDFMPLSGQKANLIIDKKGQLKLF